MTDKLQGGKVGGSDIQISLHPVGLEEEEERSPTRVKAKPWAYNELLNDSFSPECRGFWVLLPPHSTYFKSIPPFLCKG